MTVTTVDQAVLIHKWQGVASSIIGVTSIIFNSLLFGIAVRGTEPLGRMSTALLVLSSAMLCANLIGIVLGFLGARDRSSIKLYPLLGLTLNVAILTTFVVLTLVGLSMKTP